MHFDYNEEETEIEQSCESRGLESLQLDRRNSHVEEMTIDDFYEIYNDTGDISWYFYSYDLFTNSNDNENNVVTDNEKLGYIFPNNTKFDNLRAYIADIR